MEYDPLNSLSDPFFDTEVLEQEKQMSHIQWERYPTAASSPKAQTWLQIQCDLGLAQNTIEAYGRALEDFFAFSVRDGFVPEEASREHIARYVHDLPFPTQSPRRQDRCP